MMCQGDCPEQGCEYTIDVKYIYTSGRFAEPWKKTTYRCEYSLRKGCGYARRIGCPIYANAPEVR